MKAMRATAAPAAPAKSAMKKVVVVRLRPPMRAMVAGGAKVPAAPKPSALRKGAWYDALTGADKHQSANFMCNWVVPEVFNSVCNT